MSSIFFFTPHVRNVNFERSYKHRQSEEIDENTAIAFQRYSQRHILRNLTISQLYLDVIRCKVGNCGLDVLQCIWFRNLIFQALPYLQHSNFHFIILTKTKCQTHTWWSSDKTNRRHYVQHTIWHGKRQTEFHEPIVLHHLFLLVSSPNQLDLSCQVNAHNNTSH